MVWLSAGAVTRIAQEGSALKETDVPFPTSEVGDTEQPDNKNVAGCPPCSAIDNAIG
jgi:hypothetical protein